MYTQDAYTDIAYLLDMEDITPPAPSIGLRDDGVGLFYRGQSNLVFGDPESGKTLLAQCAAVDELSRGNAVLLIDLDHNGAGATVSRLISMGVDDQILRDPDRFRYCQPDDSDHLATIVADAQAWQPALILLDSLGELLPMFGASSNSPDDFTRVHTTVIKPLVKSGAAVIIIDHLPKNRDAQSFGATGTTAKKRAIGGTSLRVTVADAFKPGSGGRAHVTLNKDRHGGLRAACPSDEREPLAATFKLWTKPDGDLSWNFIPPKEGEVVSSTEAVSADDLQALSELSPPPKSQRDIKDRLHWGSARALAALKEWRRRGEPTVVLPAPEPYVSGAEEHSYNAPGALPEQQKHPAPRSSQWGYGSKEQLGAIA